MMMMADVGQWMQRWDEMMMMVDVGQWMQRWGDYDAIHTGLVWKENGT